MSCWRVLTAGPVDPWTSEHDQNPKPPKVFVFGLCAGKVIHVLGDSWPPDQ